jgi:hypothetical protein
MEIGIVWRLLKGNRKFVIQNPQKLLFVVSKDFLLHLKQLQ